MRFEIQGVDLSANTLSIIGDVTPLLTAGVKFDVIESITFALLENNFTVSTDSTVTGGLTTVHVVESLTGTQLDPAIRSSSTPMLLIAGHYVIDFSDSSKPQLIIHPYTVDVTSTSLTLPGRGTLNYGEIVIENLLHDLEHFASPISPDFPVDGQIWFNSTQNMLYVYYNGSWKSLNVVFAESAPPSPETVGQLWYDTSAIQDRPQLMVYDGTTWRSVADFYVLKSGDTMTGQLTLTGPTSPSLTLMSTDLNSTAPLIRLYNADNDPSVGGTTGTGGYVMLSNKDSESFTVIHSATGSSGTRIFTIDQDNVVPGKFDARVNTGDLYIPNGVFTDPTAAITKQFADTTYLNVVGDDMIGTLGIVAGTEVAPGLYFVGDTNNGIFSPGADQLSITTNGTERVRVFSSGNVSIGGTTDNGTDKLQVVGDISAVNTTLSGYLRGPAVFTIDPLAYGSNSGEVIINGNLTVQGTTTTVNSNTVNIGDSIITLNSDETAAPTQNGGIEIERGTSTNTTLWWNETTDKWEMYDGITSYSIVGNVVAGSGLTGGGQGPSTTLSHADTSAVADLTTATNTFVTGQTYDTYGHVLTRTTGTVDFSVAANFGFSTISIGTDSGYTWGTVNTNTNQTADTNADTVTFVAGAGINLYTNTVAATDAIKIEHVDTSSQASTTGLTGSSVFSGIGLDTFGHVTTLTTRNLTAADVGAPSTTTFDTYARRYEIVGGTFGMPDAGVVVARFVAATNISIPALNTGGSIAVAGVTATNPAVFDIQKNGVSFANLTFAASSTTGAFDTGTTTLAPGDILTVVAPGTQDATLADIAFTIVGSLI